MFNKSKLFDVSEGIAFDRNNTGFVEFGKSSAYFSPEHSQKVTYSGDDISYIEFFFSNTQTTANRVLKISINYTLGEPSSEVWEFFDSNGTSVLETRTYTYTLSSGKISTVTESIA